MPATFLFASPWPVNLLIFVPVLVCIWFRRSGRLELNLKTLVIGGLFAIAFGFVEASVVVYMRAALGFLPGFMNSLSEAAHQSFNIYQQDKVLNNLPQSLLTVEIFREAATMVMLVTVTILSTPKLKERVAMFVWAFAIWDIFYYVGLWLTVRWPYSLMTKDVLFLIPVPWYSAVWFPIFVSAASALAVCCNRK